MSWTMKRLQTAAVAALCVAVVVVEAGKKRGKKGEDPVSPYPEMSKVQADVVEWATNPMVSAVMAAAVSAPPRHDTTATRRAPRRECLPLARSIDVCLASATASTADTLLPGRSTALSSAASPCWPLDGRGRVSWHAAMPPPLATATTTAATASAATAAA